MRSGGVQKFTLTVIPTAGDCIKPVVITDGEILNEAAGP
jgi:hypothetical protein